MAHKKGMGSSKNGRDSNAKRLGVKVSDGQSILAGGIEVHIGLKSYIEKSYIMGKLTLLMNDTLVHA